jgi:hypothetical protein
MDENRRRFAETAHLQACEIILGRVGSEVERALEEIGIHEFSRSEESDEAWAYPDEE